MRRPVCPTHGTPTVPAGWWVLRTVPGEYGPKRYLYRCPVPVRHPRTGQWMECGWLKSLTESV